MILSRGWSRFFTNVLFDKTNFNYYSAKLNPSCKVLIIGRMTILDITDLFTSS